MPPTPGPSHWREGDDPTQPAGQDLATVEAAAVDVTRLAGDLALRAFRSAIALEFKGKRQDDPVTATDREVESLLRTEIRARFPDHGLLGEEHADDIAPNSAYVWTMDPLDGTANFASGLPLWGVSVAVLHHGRPVVGCIWVPVGPDLAPGVYHARLGGSAYFDDQPISVAAGADLRGRLMTLPGRSWQAFRFRRPPAGTPRDRRAGPDPRSLGSIACELVLTASGTFRLVVFLQPRIWDVAAGALIVQEAGGEVLTWQDRAWRRLDRYAAAPPPDGKGEPALRHWVQPVLAGTPELVAQARDRLAWHPRLPKRLARALGLAPQPGS